MLKIQFKLTVLSNYDQQQVGDRQTMYLWWSLKINIVLHENRGRISSDWVQMLLPIFQSLLEFLGMQPVCLCTLVVEVSTKPAPLDWYSADRWSQILHLSTSSQIFQAAYMTWHRCYFPGLLEAQVNKTRVLYAVLKWHSSVRRWYRSQISIWHPYVIYVCISHMFKMVH